MARSRVWAWVVWVTVCLTATVVLRERRDGVDTVHAVLTYLLVILGGGGLAGLGRPAPLRGDHGPARHRGGWRVRSDVAEPRSGRAHGARGFAGARANRRRAVPDGRAPDRARPGPAALPGRARLLRGAGRGAYAAGGSGGACGGTARGGPPQGRRAGVSLARSPDPVDDDQGARAGGRLAW